MQDERPVNLVIDAVTGQCVSTPLSDEEWEEYRQRTAAAEQAERDRTAQQAADHESIRQEAQRSPAFAALARKMGVQL